MRFALESGNKASVLFTVHSTAGLLFFEVGGWCRDIVEWSERHCWPNTPSGWLPGAFGAMGHGTSDMLVMA